MKEREEETRTDEGHAPGQRKGRGRQQKDEGGLTGHPPIIIPDGPLSFAASDAGDDTSTSAVSVDDIVVRFDGEGTYRHYTPEDPPTYTANAARRPLRKIDFIRVTDGTMTHNCPDVPPNCLIVVTDKKRNTGKESKIEIDARSGGPIVITFPGEYASQHEPRRPKRLRGTLKKIKRLEVFNTAGRRVHDCEIAKSGRNVRITICDDGCVE